MEQRLTFLAAQILITFFQLDLSLRPVNGKMHGSIRAVHVEIEIRLSCKRAS